MGGRGQYGVLADMNCSLYISYYGAKFSEALADTHSAGPDQQLLGPGHSFCLESCGCLTGWTGDRRHWAGGRLGGQCLQDRIEGLMLFFPYYFYFPSARRVSPRLQSLLIKTNGRRCVHAPSLMLRGAEKRIHTRQLL